MHPRWASLLNNALEKNPDAITYTLATWELVGSQTVPRARSVTHRGFLPSSTSGPLLYITTDIRMAKSTQLHASRTETGGNAEICWWIEPVREQYRITARGHLLPSPDHPWHDIFPASRFNSPIDWESERKKAFDGLSPQTRSSFCRPAPGTPLEDSEDLKKWPETLAEIGKGRDEVEAKYLEEALKNFALVVLEVVEVDFVELGSVPHRRTKFMITEGEWKEDIVAP